VLIAGLRVDDDDEHDDPVLRWPDGREVGTWREDYPYPAKMTRGEYEHLKRPLQVELVKLRNWSG
jgi:polyphosphate kinase 2 (PPK2 family)